MDDSAMDEYVPTLYLDDLDEEVVKDFKVGDKITLQIVGVVQGINLRKTEKKAKGSIDLKDYKITQNSDNEFSELADDE